MGAKTGTMKLRYPELNFILYSGIVCFLAPLLSLPVILIDPSKSNLKMDFFGFVGGVLFMGGFFFLLLLVPSLIFLNFFWKRFVFDRSNKKLMVNNFVFFFPVGRSNEIDLQEVTLSIEHRFMFSSTYGGAGSGRVWHLILNTREGKYTLGFSLIKRRLEHKKLRIERFCRLMGAEGPVT